MVFFSKPHAIVFFILMSTRSFLTCEDEADISVFIPSPVTSLNSPVLWSCFCSFLGRQSRRLSRPTYFFLLTHLPLISFSCLCRDLDSQQRVLRVDRDFVLSPRGKRFGTQCSWHLSLWQTLLILSRFSEFLSWCWIFPRPFGIDWSCHVIFPL